MMKLFYKYQVIFIKESTPEYREFRIFSSCKYESVEKEVFTSELLKNWEFFFQLKSALI